MGAKHKKMKRKKGYIYIETPIDNKLVAIVEAISEAYICVDALNNACTSTGYHYFVTTKKIQY